MCCFSVASPIGLLARLFASPVHVSKTNIFARMLGDARQALAYGMNLETDLEVAMILPLPVMAGSGEDAVRFVDLSATPRMFDDFAALFEMDVQPARRGGIRFGSSPKRLVVHDIGAFAASWVPSRADFSRLDERFRLPRVLFDAVPQYDDYGFAVFQLKPGKVTVHPMGLDFPTRAPEKLFFPTVHVHDGSFHASAKFDHALYYQHPGTTTPTQPLQSFEGDAMSGSFPSNEYAGLVDTTRSLVRRTLRGGRPNIDTWIAAANDT